MASVATGMPLGIWTVQPGALNIVQRFGNTLACLLMRLTTGRRYHDLGPLRAVRFDTLQRLDMADRTWGIPVATLAIGKAGAINAG